MGAISGVEGGKWIVATKAPFEARRAYSMQPTYVIFIGRPMPPLSSPRSSSHVIV